MNFTKICYTFSVHRKRYTCKRAFFIKKAQQVSIAPATLVGRPELAGELLVKIANNETRYAVPEIARWWVERLIQHGVTDAVLEKVSRLVRNYRFVAKIQLDRPNQRFDWVYEWDSELPPIHGARNPDKSFTSTGRLVRQPLNDEQPNSHEGFYALLVAWTISFDRVSWIRRCELGEEMRALARRYPDLKKKVQSGTYDCDRYVFGAENKKWCQKSCGSKYRVAEGRLKRRYR